MCDFVVVRPKIMKTNAETVKNCLQWKTYHFSEKNLSMLVQLLTTASRQPRRHLYATFFTSGLCDATLYSSVLRFVHTERRQRQRNRCKCSHGGVPTATATAKCMQSNGLPLPLPSQMGIQLISWRCRCRCRCHPPSVNTPHGLHWTYSWREKY